MNIKVKKIVGIIALCSICGNSMATGIPTLDIVATLQRITSMLTQISQESEAIIQTGLHVEQLASLVTQYEQTMTEYQHTLNMIAGLKNSMSNADYLQLLQMVDFTIKANPQGGTGFDVGVFDDSAYHDIDQAVGKVYGRTRDAADIAGDVIGGSMNGTDIETDSNKAYLKSKLITSQAYQTEQFTKDINDLKTRSIDAEITRQSIGTEDDAQLKSLQFMSFQNQMVLDNLQKIQEIQTAQLSYSNQTEAEYFSKQAVSIDNSIKALNAAQNKPARTISNRGKMVDF